MPDIALFGRYWTAESPIHEMDPRTKLLSVLMFMVTLFCAVNYPAMALCAAFVFALFTIAGIPVKQALKSIGPLTFIIVITALLNLFFVQNDTVLADWGWGRISQAGLHSAVFLSIRLSLLLLAASLFTLTTTTLDITDAFEKLLAPMRRIGFPAHEFAIMMGIVLRFLPQFVTEAKTIRAAQISRGAHVSANVFSGGVQGLTSLVVPLFTSAFRHAETLSAGMDARCYHGNEGRTHLNPLHFTRLDAFAAITVIAVFAATVIADTLI